MITKNEYKLLKYFYEKPVPFSVFEEYIGNDDSKLTVNDIYDELIKNSEIKEIMKLLISLTNGQRKKVLKYLQSV